MSKLIRIAITTAVIAACAVALPALALAGQGGKWKLDPTINAPWAQEDDQQPLDSPATATGLCRWSPFTSPFVYAPTTNTDVIFGDALNLSGSSNFGCSTPQNETTVAVNPTNPLNIVAGANDYRVCCDFAGLNDGSGWAYFSYDGGVTWGNTQVPGLTAQTGGQGNFKRVDAAGDPALAFGPDGRLYYANIVFSRVSPANGIAVSTSDDGGATWSGPTMVSWNDAGNWFNDKEWIAAGPDGKVVVTWTKFSLGPLGAGYLASPIVMAFSKDRGRTWNRQGSPVSDPSHPYDQGSIPQFDAAGNLYVAYEGATASSGFTQDATVVARSTNDGLTFTNTEVGRVYDDFDCYPFYGGRQTLTGEHFRLNSFPSFSIDQVTGGLAIVWADNRGVGSCGTGSSSFSGTTNASVTLVTSADGTTFTAPQTLGAGDVVFPAVAAANGKIAVSYYTRAYSGTHSAATCKVATGVGGASAPPVATTSSVCLDYAARSSSDGFASELRLSTEGSNPYVQFANGAFIGDYSGLALTPDGSTAFPVWTDFRGRPGTTAANQDVYFQPFTP